MTIKQLTDTQKGQILAWRKSNESMQTIAEHLGCSPQTIFNFLQKVRKTGSTSRRPGSGRKQVTSVRDDRRIVKMQKKKDWGVTAAEIKNKLGLELKSVKTPSEIVSMKQKQV